MTQPVSDVFGQVLDVANTHHVTFAISRLESGVRDLLKTYDLLDRVGENNLYRTKWCSRAGVCRAAIVVAWSIGGNLYRPTGTSVTIGAHIESANSGRLKPRDATDGNAA